MKPEVLSTCQPRPGTFFFFFLPRLLPEAWRGGHVPRAGALSPPIARMCELDLSMSFSALSVFKWGQEKMQHF